MNVDLLHTGWAAAIGTVAAGAFLDVADIARPATGTGSMDETTGDVGNDATPVAAGVACRVQRLTAMARPREHGGEQVTAGDVRVEFARTVTDLRVGDIVTLTAAQDPWLADRALRVTEPTGNTLHATRVVYCSSDSTPSG